MRATAWLSAPASQILLRGGAVGFAIALVFWLGLLTGVERWALNALFALRGPLVPRTPIAIVSINEDSFDELDMAWPWPRAMHGRLLDRLSGKPAVVAFDLVFSEPSARGPQDDLAFAEAIGRAGNVILASAMTVTQENGHVKEDMNAPIAVLRKQAAGYGFANFETDDDASVRRAVLTRRHQERDISSFDLQTHRVAKEAGLSSAPIDAQTFLINFRGGPKTFLTIPYYRILNGEVSADELAGKIVLVGATSTVLQDMHPTPFAAQGNMPGIEIHANVLETIFLGIPLRSAPRETGVVVALLAGIAAVWVTKRLRPLLALALSAGLAAGYAGVAFATFVYARQVLDLVAVPLALVLGYGVTVVENFIHEQRQRAALMQLFSKHVSPEVAAAIWEERDMFMAGGRLRSQKLIATVLFTDLKGFTSISERLDTQALMDWINAYMEVMAQLVMEHGGVVDDYFGDAIKANFGVPFPRTTEAEMREDACHAVDCALSMERQLIRMNDEWKAQGLPTVGMRVGIFTGEVVVGCLGSAQRMKYTTIGDTVNTASRLESFEKEQEELADSPCRILIGESTLRFLSNGYQAKRFGELSLKGKARKISVYRITGRTGDAAQRPSPQEARRHRRLALTGSVVIRSEADTVTATLLNLSHGGLAVAKLAREVMLGRVVALEFELSSFPFRLQGKAVWAAQDQAGFMFVSVSPHDQLLLEQYLEKHHAPVQS